MSPGLNAQATTHAAEMLRALRELEPDQQAALTASAARASAGIDARPSGTFPVVIGMVVLVIVGGAALCFIRGPFWSVAAGALVLVLPLAPIGLWATRQHLRRLEKGQEEADLLVAGAMNDPSRLVDALRRLERVELDSFRGGSEIARFSTYRRRRERLERRLGLDGMRR
ncbi:MAG TPA: hypothetical protein VK689_02705 [Armatimonadota bacterium]|nr:hypothetical protein [Armatimonadota bacterium]